MMRILIISYSPINRDPRVLRQIDLLKHSNDLVVAGYGNFEGDGTKFVSLDNHLGNYRKSILEKFKTLLRLLRRNFNDYYWATLEKQLDYELLRKFGDFDLIIANDFEAAPLALKLRSKDCRVVVDAHEFTPNEIRKGIRMFLFGPYQEWICSSTIHRVDRVFCVSSGIAELYSSMFEVPKPIVIRNTPAFRELGPKSIDPNHIKLVHHGVALPDRGIEEIIMLMDQLDSKYQLYLMLVPIDAKYFSKLKDRVSHSDRIHLMPTVPTEQISISLNDYDLGIFIPPNVSLNHEFMLPNKFFEFIQARLGVVVTNLPEMSDLVIRHGLGLVLDFGNLHNAAGYLNKLSNHEIAIFKERANKIAKQLSWESESEKFLSNLI